MLGLTAPEAPEAKEPIGRPGWRVGSLAPPDRVGQLVRVFGVFRGAKAGGILTANHANHVKTAAPLVLTLKCKMQFLASAAMVG
jgi:hypothetical protein